ncbi:phosphoserine phosphatase SerB [Arthrobacter sp. H14-L1]|uniref:phosphoserine phosphatase SerB n=1 Tax=Arthrobacter sp. H14-L1 TaxID=2996697 RepID=UPI00226E6EC3|nr:phosphoserine phosphatase SerB [Arthrobacter sp. H14-L1]MCY0906488.1 phosphoserine phosphatase SerB [Arthrobacter sp. H14-L1]
MPSTYTAVSYGQSLPAAALEQIRSTLAGCGARMLSEHSGSRPGYEFCVMEVAAAGPADLRQIRASLAAADAKGPGGTDAGADQAGTAGAARARVGVVRVDTAVVPAALRRAKRKLIVLDVDSTLIQQEVIELLAAHAGTGAEVAAVTEAAMRGELDFAQSLHARVATLAGLPDTVLAEVGRTIKLSKGADRLVRVARAAGHVVGAVSGGFSQLLSPLSKALDLDYALANELEIVDGVLTGRVVGAVVDRAAKATSLRQWARTEGIELSCTVAIGDGANDLDMMEAAGLSIAYNAKPAVRAAADAQINLPDLDVALVLAGI